MKTTIQNITIINEGRRFEGNLLIEDGCIAAIGSQSFAADKEIDGQGMLCLPGVIDTHVHFRDPGLTNKADFSSESKAAVAGGITSVIDMPNTLPPAITIGAWKEKCSIASAKSLTNYSFFLGAGANTIQELEKGSQLDIGGVKLFMGASTGNMHVEDNSVIDALFEKCTVPIIVHCEDNDIIASNVKHYKEKYGDDIAFKYHALIRSREACVKSTQKAIHLSKKHQTPLHIAHLSTADELALLEKGNVADKLITGEVCIPHLSFTEADYDRLKGLLKCNPSVKGLQDREALRRALNDDILDTIATDHAPHTLEEKSSIYWNCPSGVASIQFSLLAVLELVEEGYFSLEKLVEKMCHNPAIRFGIGKRGFIKEGYCADLVLVKKQPFTVEQPIILSKCGWSPFKKHTFSHTIAHTIVNGHTTFVDGKWDELMKGQPLSFQKN